MSPTCERVCSADCPGGGGAVSADVAVSYPHFLLLEEAGVSCRRRRRLCSALGESQVKAADGLSRLITLAPRLTANTTQGKSNERRPEPVKVPHGLLWNFNAWIRTKREVRGSCRHQLELFRRISTEDRLARELARLQTIFNWLWVGWLLSPCHSDSSEKYNKGQRPCELHDKPKAKFEA